MGYVLVLLVALLSKGFFNSKLCKGEFGFFKTYFIFGGIGSFSIMIVGILIFGPSALSNDHGTGLVGVRSVGRLIMFLLGVYLSGIGLAIYRIKKKGGLNPLMELYIWLLVIMFILLLPSTIVMAPVHCVVYAIALYALYKLSWNEVFIERVPV